MLFDWLVTGGTLPANPAAAVRGPKHVVKVGKTSVLTASEARALLDSIPLDTIGGLRDRALIAVMVYSFARVGAVVKMRVEDYYVQGAGAGSGFTKKAASTTSFPPITMPRLTWTPTLKQPVPYSALIVGSPCSLLWTEAAP